MVRRIAQRHRLEDPFVALPGGITNHVFTNGEQVVRFPRDPQRGVLTDVGEFAKEAWCAARAREAGVSTPEVWVADEVSGVPYQVQSLVAGGHADEHTPALWRRLGEVAARLAAMPLGDAPASIFSRFGRDLPAAWRQHVEYNLAALGDGDRLLELGVYGAADLGWLREWVAACEFEGLSHGLHHGDLNPGNVLVDEAGDLVLIDWGSATAGPVPWGDLVHLQRGGFEHQAEDFTAAFGVTAGAVAETLPRFDLLQALDLVRWAIDRRPDLLDQYVEQATATVRRVRPTR